MAADAGAAAKQVSFEDDVMEVDDKFEQLKQPVYKGKKLDDPINTAVVRSPLPPPLLSSMKFGPKLSYRTNGSFSLPFSKSRDL
jgi:hypothetical protein